LQAAGYDGVAFDAFSFQQDGPATPEAGNGRRQVADALLISKMIIVGDDFTDLCPSADEFIKSLLKES
jgi:hypothetical protein